MFALIKSSTMVSHDAIFRSLLLLVVAAVLPHMSIAADMLLYDDDASTQLRQIDRGYEAPDAAYEGNSGIRLTPTYWHKPFLRLKDRTDFRPYDVLEFMIRSTQGPMNQQLIAWDYAMGSWVEVGDYVEGGGIDTEWKKATIPLVDMVSDDFPLDSVFILMFNKSPSPQDFEVDNVWLRQLSGPTIQGHEQRSQRSLTVRIDNIDHDSVKANGPGAFVLKSTTDLAYQWGVSPVSIGISRSAVDANEAGGVTIESQVHMLFEIPLLPDHDYVLTTTGFVNDNGYPPNEAEYTISPVVNTVSPSVQVNQVGYTPASPKIGYVGNWLGDLGPLPVDTSTFSIVDTSNESVVYQGELSLRVAADVQSGADVYEANFTTFETSGTYRLEVPGIGRSFDFQIASNAFDDVYRTVTRLLYHKRNTYIGAPFADQGMDRDGVDQFMDAVYHPILADYSLSRNETPGDYKEIRGGWFDAGDYGLYMHNAYPIWGAINIAFDLAPDGHFQDNELNIPESGNGIPDILDELAWGMDWALSMQDDVDGGVYWRVCSQTWDFGMPSDIDEPRLIYEKTTRATAQLAAMGAIYARLMEPYDSEKAAVALLAARKAWDFVKTHPAYPPEGVYYKNPEEMPGGGEYSVPSSLYEQVWAAAELYRTTGEISFQDDYRDILSTANIDISAAPFTTFPFWALVMTDHDDRDVILQEEARRAILIAADQKLDWASQHPYRVPKHPNIIWNGWHSTSGSVMNSLALFQAHYLSGEKAYSDLAWMTPAMTLGANPLSRSFITGVGARPPLDPLDRISLLDGVDEPVRGMPSPGFTWHLPGFREPFISVNSAYYPPEQPIVSGDYSTSYPVLRRYIDSHALIPMNEGTIREAGTMAAAFALMRDGSNPPLVDGSYDWVAGSPKAAKVFGLKDIPLYDVHLLFPEQITSFGGHVGIAPAEWVAAITPDQSPYIDSPGIPYWVSRLAPASAEALTADQIANFETWSLFVALPPSRVSLILPESFALIPWPELKKTSLEWQQQLTDSQIQAMTQEQLGALYPEILI